MNKAFKIIIIFIMIAAICGLAFWSYPIIKNRYFPVVENEEKNEDIQRQDAAENVQVIVPETPKIEEGDEGGSFDVTESEALQKESDEEKNTDSNVTTDIDKDDCDNECEGFSGNNLEYCRQVCGLAATLEEAANCGDKSGLEKDYCLKDLAISKKDFSICEQIKDEDIKKTCKNRITEDIFDE